MRPLLHLTSTAVAIALAGALAATAVPGAAGATTTRAAAPALVKVKPEKLARGADPSVAHMEGSTLVDGATRIAIDAVNVELLGRSGPDYLVAARDEAGVGPVLRVTPGGAKTVVVTPSKKGDVVLLSADGSRLAQSVAKRRFTSTKVTVWSSTEGSVVSTRAFPGVLRVLDLDAKRMILSSDTGTVTWKLSSGLVRKVTARRAYLADIATDRLASFDKDPYDGGCSIVTSLRKPTKLLWKSCRDRVEEFAPDGQRAVTVDLLSDGIGPGVVTVRNSRGKAEVSYGIRGYFGLLTWEDDANLLMESYGRTQSALVRCAGTTCARATEVAPTPAYRARA